jgi:hypothetical protein
LNYSLTELKFFSQPNGSGDWAPGIQSFTVFVGLADGFNSLAIYSLFCLSGFYFEARASANIKSNVCFWPQTKKIWVF